MSVETDYEICHFQSMLYIATDYKNRQKNTAKCYICEDIHMFL